MVGIQWTLPGEMLDELKECEFINISLEWSKQEKHWSGDKSEHTGVCSSSLKFVSSVSL